MKINMMDKVNYIKPLMIIKHSNYFNLLVKIISVVSKYYD